MPGRAVRLMSDWALLDMGFARVEAWVELDNTASQQVLMSSGFDHEGTLRSASLVSRSPRRRDGLRSCPREQLCTSGEGRLELE